MAKKRRVKPSSKNISRTSQSTDSAQSQGSTGPIHAERLEPLAIASAIFAGALVYVAYHPSDSVAVERGDALWFAMITIVVATLTFARHAWLGRLRFQSQRSALVIDGLAVSLAAWMMLAAFATSPPGNLRMATNEAWLWVSGVAVFCTGRRLMESLSVRRAMITLLIACGTGVAVHGLHQHWVSLPQNRADYLAAPDQLLADAQVVAPPGSVQRMIFENRLFDGGPTGTFALANSLAGVLVIVCVLITGVLRFGWPSMRHRDRVVWGITLLVGAYCLWAARSRSATAACVLGITAVIVAAALLSAKSGVQSSCENDELQPSGERHAAKQHRFRVIIAGVCGLFASALGIGCIMVAVGNKEWFEQAPASLSFRFQYWRSTMRMALDHPWFAAGPGNFQAIYERYREESASEQVADAHNFLFETLAAGGFIGLGLLFGLSVTVIICVYQRIQSPPQNRATSELNDSDPKDDFAKWVWLGAGLALAMVWLIGAAAGHTPDFQAHKYAVPLACLAAYLLWPAVKERSASAIDLVSAVAAASLLIHLLVAGGWTVPGVAMPLWILMGILTRVHSGSRETSPQVDSCESTTTNWKSTGIVVLLGLSLLLAHRLISLAPVEAAAQAMRMAEFAKSERQMASMYQAVDRAIDADPWWPDACLQKADLVHWELVYRGDEKALRGAWQTQLQEAFDRAGENPAIYREGGLQGLHLYQCFGTQHYLDLADRWLETAAQWSPANHGLAAQRSAIAQKQGQSEKAKQLAHKAARLAKLGNNVERELSRQMIYVIQPLGKPAAEGPQLKPASDVLADLISTNQLDTGRVTTEN